MFEFEMEDYLSPESFALLGGFFVFVFLIWYNEVDRIIFEDNAPNRQGGNYEHRNRNQRKRVNKIFYHTTNMFVQSFSTPGFTSSM